LNTKSKFLTNGFLMPTEVLPYALINRIKDISDEIILNRPNLTSSKSKFNTHLKLPLKIEENIFLRLACHPTILSYLKEILGENIILWHSHIYIKDNSSKNEVKWHQDSFYFPLCPKEAVTVWINLSEPDGDNGSMIFVPNQTPTEIVHTSDNEHIAFKYYINDSDIDESTGVSNIRDKGQFSIHEIKTVHKSLPIKDDFVRNTIIFRYMAADVYYNEVEHKNRLIDEFKKNNLVLSEDEVSVGCIVISGKNMNEKNNILASLVR
jgi:hypothetical protein